LRRKLSNNPDIYHRFSEKGSKSERNEPFLWDKPPKVSGEATRKGGEAVQFTLEWA